jgi:uncharacterized pyridoxal phosphate-containing UPF0001 family protein
MISENIATLRARIRDVSLKCKRNPSEIKIIGITKSRAIDQLQEAFASGIEDFGENKVQEASLKHRGFPQAIWHMVGHL